MIDFKIKLTLDGRRATITPAMLRAVVFPRCTPDERKILEEVFSNRMIVSQIKQLTKSIKHEYQLQALMDSFGIDAGQLTASKASEMLRLMPPEADDDADDS